MILGQRNPDAAHQDAELVMLFTGGATMTEIGAAVGLTRERVRQRLKRIGYTGKDHHGWKSSAPWIAQHRRREAKDAAREARFQADVAKLRALADQLGYTPTFQQAAEALGAPKGIWQGSGSMAWLAARAGRQWHRGAPYAPYTRRLYAAAGFTTRPPGEHGKLGSPHTHCRRGHEYTPENTYIWKMGKRWCRTCRRVYRRALYQRRKTQVVA